ncbi:hypothetical protein [Sphingomonas soli]|uniref:hypothetical protein n=1 Tax=Sphingomonas soli TaxID=266127 RepID=UPI000830F158|nr:hypothetical protein [Sphingomonas soli]
MSSSPAPTIIAAAVARARRRISAYFFVEHAISADEAVPYAPQSRVERHEFERMQKRGVIRSDGDGKYWLDTAAYQADADRRRRILVPVVIVLVIAVALAIMFAGYRG